MAALSFATTFSRVQPGYLDHNASTPLDPQVLAAMHEVLEQVHGNPSSVHQAGRHARTHLDACRERIAALWHCEPAEIVFTSGATESNNLALLGAARARRVGGRHLVTSAVEHPSVLAPLQHLAAREGFRLTVIPPDTHGRVDPAAVEAALEPDTVLVSVQAANNEIGTLQPVAEIGALCRTRGICFHTDAVQWFGKEPVPEIACFNADLVSCSAHKLFGPKGVGVLFRRRSVALERILHGGSQEDEYRPGTENLAGITGLVAALERFLDPPVFDRRLLVPLIREIEQCLDAIPGAVIFARGAPRLANTVAFAVEGTDSLSVLAGLDLAGFAASSGSACSTGALQPSHVIRALGVNNRLASALVRLSVGPATLREAVARLVTCLPGVINRVQAGG